MALNCVGNEYRWLQNEYKKTYGRPNRYLELSPKQIKGIISKYEIELHNNETRKLIFKKVLKIQQILDKRLKKYESETYNELNRYGNLSEYRFYQFIVAYKRALENYYKQIVLTE